jgi:hypothetical protein
MKLQRRTVLQAVGAVLISSRAASPATQDTSMNHIIEIVTFKLAGGASPEGFLQAATATNAFLQSQKGFVARRMSVDGDGNYIDSVEWKTLADAKAALDVSMQTPALMPFIQMIDPASMKMVHNSVVTAIG